LCNIFRGKFLLEWYYDKNGKSVAYDYFKGSTEELQDKFLVLVKKMGEFGKIFDKTKFRNEGDVFTHLSPNQTGICRFSLIIGK